MGNFQSIRTRLLGSRTPDEEEGGAYPNLQNQYRSNKDSSVEILLFFSSIYKATKAILQNLNVVVSRKAADPSLPIQNPLLAPTPQICSRGDSSSHNLSREFLKFAPTTVCTKASDPSLPIQNPSPHEPLLASSLHSLSVDTVGSLTGLISDEIVDHVVSVPEIRCSNEIQVEISPCLEIKSSRKEEREVKEQVKTKKEKRIKHVDHEIDGDHVVSVPEIRCLNEIQVEISPCLEESVEINSSRKGKEKVKRNIAVVEKEKGIKHYSSRHKILLVGEGDFSFSACLALAFGSAANIIATSLDSQAFLKEHYGKAMHNISQIRRRDGKVMHRINATKMANYELLQQLKFDRIIYNFPYAGIFDKSVPTESQLRRHRKLVSKFLMNAKNMLSENGEIHITHKTNSFHADFKVESIASTHGLKLIEAVTFERGDYPGYYTKYGFGGDRNFDCNPSKTFKFGLKSVSF